MWIIYRIAIQVVNSPQKKIKWILPGEHRMVLNIQKWPTIVQDKRLAFLPSEGIIEYALVVAICLGRCGKMQWVVAQPMQGPLEEDRQAGQKGGGRLEMTSLPAKGG